jgi:hypothetical protein
MLGALRKKVQAKGERAEIKKSAGEVRHFQFYEKYLVTPGVAIG